MKKGKSSYGIKKVASNEGIVKALRDLKEGKGFNRMLPNGNYITGIPASNGFDAIISMVIRGEEHLYNFKTKKMEKVPR